MRHRVAELGDRCTYVQADTYSAGLAGVDEELSVCHPTSRAALRFVQERRGVDVLPPRGFATTLADFERWVAARGSRRLLMEDFYRDTRRRLGVLMERREPAGGRWNFDADNREPPPRSATLGVSEPACARGRHRCSGTRGSRPWERDGHVTFLGSDGPRRFAATRAEARAVFDGFIQDRLPTFGPFEDAMLSRDQWMAHSLLSAPANLGLLDPLEIVARAEDAYRSLLGIGGGLHPATTGWRSSCGSCRHLGRTTAT
jgi:deoxyribodipyrimidine photolyase-related protein